MSKLNFIKTDSKNINFITEAKGNVLYCTDNNKVYCDNINNIRVDISKFCLILKTEDERKSITNALLNKAYIVSDTEKFYSYDGYRWTEIDNEAELYQATSTLDEFVPGVIVKDSKIYAPNTLASQVYMQDGSMLSANLNSSRILSITKTKSIEVEAVMENQRVFSIPYPITDYNFKENHMSIILRGRVLRTEDYVINNDNIVLNREIDGLVVNEKLIFIFFYTEHIDLNGLVILNTQNYADNSITSEKLSENIRISAYNIVEKVDRIFFSSEEQDKLKHIEKNATCYHHPATHPATIIVEDQLHRFLSDAKIKEYDNKANKEDVYSKTEMNKKLEEIIGAAPEALNTLAELAAALDNDDNHASNMVKELANKISRDEFQQLAKIVENKVNIDDYVRSPIYGTPSRVNKLNCSYYTISSGDKNLKEYVDGMQIILKIAETNIGKSYLSVNNLEPKRIITVEGYDLIREELVPQSLYTLRYNGTTGNFILQGKGGVKITDTSLETYIVAKDENITRGDILDYVNNTIIKSVPRTSVISNLETTETKYNSESNIELYKVDSNRFIVFWKFKKVFQAQVFSLTNGFIDISPLTIKKPIVINSDCIAFKVDTMGGSNYILSYADSKNRVTTQIVSVKMDSTIQLLTPHVQDENELVANINIIYTNNNRAIIGWNYGDKVRCLLISTDNNTISVISSRDNLQYPLDTYCLLDPSQILFCSAKDKEINGWVMSISDNDFANSTIVNLVSSRNYDFVEPVISLSGERKVIMEWTDKEQRTFFRQYLSIDYKGKIEFSEPFTMETEEIRVKSDLNNKYINVTENFYMNVSNMNYKMPSIKGGIGDKCIKITVSKIDNASNSCKIVDEHTSITKVTADNLSYDFLDKTHMVLAYNTKINKTDETHLFFAVLDIRKIPFGVAVSCAKANEVVSVSRW